MKKIKRFQCDPYGAIEIFYKETIENNGQIIEIGELQRVVSGINYANFLALLQQEVDADSPTPVINWIGFNDSISRNEAYNRIRYDTENQIVAARLEAYSLSIAAGVPIFIDRFIEFWNLVISGSATPPTPEEINEWREIFARNKLFVNITDAGLIDGTPN